MATQLYFTKSTLADGFAQDILANFAFVWQQLDIGSLLFSYLSDLIRIADRLIDGSSRLFHCLTLVVGLADSVGSYDCLAVVQKVYHRSCRVVRTARQVSRRVVQ